MGSRTSAACGTTRRALFTPLELPEELSGQKLSAGELRARAEAAGDQLVAAGEWKGFENSGGVGAYGFHWFDWFFDERQDIGQPALVVQPATGRVPDRTVTARELLATTAIEEFDAAERMDADDRCITRGPSGMFPTHVNNGKLILQIPGYVVIHAEMIHNSRNHPNRDPARRREGPALERRPARPLGGVTRWSSNRPTSAPSTTSAARRPWTPRDKRRRSASPSRSRSPDPIC